MSSREPATEQEAQWAYKLVAILLKLGKTRKQIAEGSNLSSSTIARLANKQVRPTKHVWRNLYEYGRTVDNEMHNRQLIIDDSREQEQLNEKPIDQKFKVSHNHLIWIN